MQTEAYAKINLTLDITGTDHRGYHLLSSVFAEISLSDTVSLTPGGKGISLSCSDPAIPADGKNLCVKAANAFLDGFSLTERDFHIGLIKRIPSQAGLGGGSSDGAAVLKLLCRHFGVSPEDPKVQAIALSVGADVPFFLKGGACLAEGIGERLTVLDPIRGYYIVLAKTAEAASTPEVYRLYDGLSAPQSPTTPAFLNALRNGAEIAPHVSNHLTAATATVCPSVCRLKKQLRASGALASEMSGSGSAVYGLFSDEITAKNAMNTIEADFCEICRFV